MKTAEPRLVGDRFLSWRSPKFRSLREPKVACEQEGLIGSQSDHQPPRPLSLFPPNRSLRSAAFRHPPAEPLRYLSVLLPTLRAGRGGSVQRHRPRRSFLQWWLRARRRVSNSGGCLLLSRPIAVVLPKSESRQEASGVNERLAIRQCLGRKR